jgi:hypothetical protein
MVAQIARMPAANPGDGQGTTIAAGRLPWGRKEFWEFAGEWP